jgi:mRNA interferase YafQ
MIYTVKPTTRFKRDYKLMEKRQMNLALLRSIVASLANGAPLDTKHNDHPLTGNYTGHRECHIEPDWLLIYRIENDVLVLSLTRTGTHSDLFGS